MTVFKTTLATPDVNSGLGASSQGSMTAATTASAVTVPSTMVPSTTVPSTTALSRNFGRFMPEPKSRYDNLFGNLLQVASSVASQVTGSISNSPIGRVDPLYVDLINKQIEVQQQMQLVSFHSNIERSKHETQMAAVRNMRVG